MSVEQIDKDAAADYLEGRGERALALRARNVGGTLAEAFARHRIDYAATRLVKAEALIKEFLDHEGAEGWSDYLHKMIEEYGEF